MGPYAWRPPDLGHEAQQPACDGGIPAGDCGDDELIRRAHRRHLTPARPFEQGGVLVPRSHHTGNVFPTLAWCAHPGVPSLGCGLFLRRIGDRLQGWGLRPARRSCGAYGGAILGRSDLHTSAPLSRQPARLGG